MNEVLFDSGLFQTLKPGQLIRATVEEGILYETIVLRTEDSGDLGLGVYFGSRGGAKGVNLLHSSPIVFMPGDTFPAAECDSDERLPWFDDEREGPVYVTIIDGDAEAVSSAASFQALCDFVLPDNSPEPNDSVKGSYSEGELNVGYFLYRLYGYDTSLVARVLAAFFEGTSLGDPRVIAAIVDRITD